MSNKETKRYIVSGGLVTPITIPEGLIGESIPTAIYDVVETKMGYALKYVRDKFELPNVLYGSVHNRTLKLFRSYDNRSVNTGALFTGLKGAGKTLLMKNIANEGIDRGLPVLQVNSRYTDQEFISFIDSIGECIVIFDEFGKVYTRNHDEDTNSQDSLLTLFDGLFSSKRITLIAENHSYNISEFLLKRPSRILYHWEYSRLEEEVIDGYCSDNLIKPTFISDIKNIYYQAKEFTFDSLQSIVAQCNLFNDMNFDELIDGLNISLPVSEDIELVSVHKNEEKLTLDKIKILNLVDNFRIFLPIKDDTYEWRTIHDGSVQSIISGVESYTLGDFTIKVVRTPKEIKKLLS